MQAATRTAPEHLSIVIVGHVDHGKSTLLGRLYADTGSLPDGKLERVQAICRQQGKEFEYAFLFDAFLEEQEQGITIDTARTFFSWGGREYVVIDAPGHKEFLKNMVSGAARAEAALLVIDAWEGVQEQSRRHGLLLSLLGVRQVAVVVNKMDLVGFDRAAYDAIVAEFSTYLEQLGVRPERFVPASARGGDNVVERGSRLPWYDGPTVAETLGLFRKSAERADQPFRFPVQDVYKFDERRIIAGRVAAGRLRVGDRLVFWPSGKSARVRTVEGFNVNPPPLEARAGESTGLTLDEQIFVERGEVATHLDARPLIGSTLRATVFWMGGRPLELHRNYLLRLATREVECRVLSIERIVDAVDLAARQTQAAVGRNEVAELTLRTRSPIAFDRHEEFEVTGRFVLVDGYDVAGGGIITGAPSAPFTGAPPDWTDEVPARSGAPAALGERRGQFSHQSALVLLVGEPETTAVLARRLRRDLEQLGGHVYVFDASRAPRVRSAEEDALAWIIDRAVWYLLDAGLIVIATAPGVAPAERATIGTSIDPAPLVVAHLGRVDRTPLDSGDLEILASGVDAQARAIVDALRGRGILMAAYLA